MSHNIVANIFLCSLFWETTEILHLNQICVLLHLLVVIPLDVSRKTIIFVLCEYKVCGSDYQNRIYLRRWETSRVIFVYWLVILYHQEGHLPHYSYHCFTTKRKVCMALILNVYISKCYLKESLFSVFIEKNTTVDRITNQGNEKDPVYWKNIPDTQPVGHRIFYEDTVLRLFHVCFLKPCSTLFAI